ncbi:hypothetical protein COV42_00185 [Candidatus Campbellbacteria bacterium CG11_big_fil_rev_8_21_14_0_20_44_21]|nr:MAG: hypothetical protein COV42_00185 [Candidatus Campbellbacteria bacterium CG11_big_fil_rev_8_21_14_0_20_44_21]
MYNIITVEDSKRKSSRSKADLFEVLVAIRLSNIYKLKKDKFEKAKQELENIISKFPDGEKRIEEQHRRSKILTPTLVEKLNSEIIPIHGKLKAIDWIGRRWQEEETLSDLDLTFDSGFLMGISLKSTRQGLGTQKNLGYEKLKDFLGLDIDKELDGMWENIRRELSRAGGELVIISSKSRSEIKNAKYRFPVIQKIGRRYGIPVQEVAVDKSIKLFNALPKEKRLAFLEEIFGIKSTKPVLNILVEKDNPRLSWNETMRGLIEGELVAEKIKDKSYRILADKNPIIRLQASFTNGIGLSAFCERAFLL